MPGFKCRVWPWSIVIGTEFAEGDEVKDGPEQMGPIVEDFVGLILSHPKKKSSKDYASQDEINNFARDAGIKSLEDEDYKGLRPDKKMNMVKIQNWKPLLLKPFKGKKAPAANIMGDIIAKMKAAVADMKVKMEAEIKKRKDEAIMLGKLNKFFDACKISDTASMEESLKAEPWLLNAKHPQKGGGTPCMAAVREGQMKSLEWLIEQKCDFSIEDNFNYTALNWAEDADNEKFITKLKEVGCPMGAGDEDEDEEDDDDAFDEAAVADMIS
mmetsp:Transcript_10991/g.26971  ORF Transcript_10991/g.26971 Transcript_10991/m.26971 type:complete len:270 (+) Transcript_10991:96-905(+)|eukprot:CAMPEP_0114495802 /NCGR_PEP_ID=MMETSP0109-20121206/5418_1 /TAXON_ID=29199 /ORGANISM="Chlorarachnion reptans, Strain CCCM449" /LENGTH=269 /DNA_ID=CAMNT_0001673007 /DNA_START=112 /DNA_END=921 /DNA_ORIENTATION=-